MLLNSWKMPVVAGREHDLHDFCEREFLAVLQNQAACLGAYFSQTDQDLICFTLWQDQATLLAFEQHTDYLHLLTSLMRQKYVLTPPVSLAWPIQAGYQQAGLALRLAQLSQPSFVMEELA